MRCLTLFNNNLFYYIVLHCAKKWGLKCKTLRRQADKEQKAEQSKKTRIQKYKQQKFKDWKTTKVQLKAK